MNIPTSIPKLTPEQKAAETMAAMQSDWLTLVSGPDGWAFSGLINQYATYELWQEDVCKKNAAFKAVVSAHAFTRPAIEAALVAYYKSLEPPPPAPVFKPVTPAPGESTSPGITPTFSNATPLWFDPWGKKIDRILAAVEKP